MGFRKIHKLTYRAEYTPSTWRGDGVGADIYENSYAFDATLRRSNGYCFWLNAFVSATRHM